MKKSASFIFILLLSGLLSLCLIGNATAKEIKWKVCFYSAVKKGFKPAEKFILDLEKELEGQIDFQIFEPGEHPYNPADIMKAVRDNIMQIGFALTLYSQSWKPQMGAQELPLLWGSQDEFITMMRDPSAKDIFDYILREPLEEWNQIPIAWYSYPGYMFAGPNWVEDFESLKGQRYRIYSAQMGEMVKIFGGVPVNVVWGEVYTALQRKMIDGFLTATGAAYQAKLYENVKYVTIADYQVGLHYFSVNKDALKSLPKELQSKFMKVTSKLGIGLQEEYLRFDEANIKEAMKENGVRFKYINPSFREKAREKIKPVWTKWAKTTGGRAPEMFKRIEDYHLNYIKTHK